MANKLGKLGKRPAAPRRSDFLWRDLAADVAVELPRVPSRFGHANVFHGDDWLMLGNGPDDTVAPGFGGCGDCVWAGAAHEHRMLSKVVHHRDLAFTGECVVADYSAATGYDPADPSTDQGTDVHAALGYRRQTGIADATGNRHKIGAYVALDPKNWQHLLEATYVFGVVGIGFNFPASAWTQFDAGEPWDVVASDGGSDGGHYTPVMGTLGHASVGLVSWARRQEMTQAFYERYNDESWTYVTPEALNSAGKGLRGFDIDKLNSLLAALKN